VDPPPRERSYLIDPAFFWRLVLTLFLLAMGYIFRDGFQ